MDKHSQKDEFEKLKKVLDRKTKEFEIIKQISSQINKTLDVNLIASAMLNAMDEFFGFKYSMILLVDEKMQKLNVLATHGYEIKGIGASVKLGVGVIGIVAKKKKMMRMANLGMQRSYMKAIKSQITAEEKNKLGNEVELPGLKNAESQVAIPMLFNNELIGVLSVESEKVNIFNNSDELLIGILANQTANALQNAKLYQLEQKRKLELNRLFNDLKINNSSLSHEVEQKIWKLWSTHPNDKNLTEMLDEGSDLVNNQKLNEAIIVFSKVIELDPNWAEAWNKRATVLYLIGEYQKSQNDIDKVLELEKRHFGALAGQGLVNIQLKNYEKAIMSYQKAKKIYPTMKSPDLMIKQLEKLIKKQSI